MPCYDANRRLVDRNGNPIAVSYAPHELEWLKAACNFRGLELEHAIFDISEMTGRSFRALREKVYKMREVERQESRAMFGASFGKNWLPEPQRRVSRRVFVEVATQSHLKRKKAALPPSHAFGALTEFEKQTGRREKVILAAE